MNGMYVKGFISTDLKYVIYFYNISWKIVNSLHFNPNYYITHKISV